MALRRLLQGIVLPRTTGRHVGASFSTEAGETIRATLFPGDGIGPEIAESVKQVEDFVSLGCRICVIDSCMSSYHNLVCFSVSL
ncbi:unnamed protein product [Triticum turgidum subsp. durum]|uniref:Isopropylmalate dehydrogenase-like domain-containing protein n=1 Tax=Triticum turgidum subsp. durum TaxID=4567 RepID=A0A9R0Y172_TRITD|nr:unnamed protein product [Triticum turgidum subsp. durum]